MDETEVTVVVLVGWLVVIGLTLFVLIEPLVKRMTIAHLRTNIGGLYMKDTKELKLGDRVHLHNHGYILDTNQEEGIITERIYKQFVVRLDNDGSELIFFPESMTVIQKTLDTLHEGDVVVNEDGNERTVLGVCGRVYLMSGCSGSDYYDNGYTVEQLKEYDYKVKGAEEEETAMTVEEVSNLVGKKVKIVAEGGK